MANPKAPGPVVAILEEITFVIGSIRARGIKHYAKALGIGVAMVVVSNKFVFRSAQEKIGAIRGQLDAARATAQYADTYKELDQNLRIYATRLPPVVKPEVWFFDTVRDSMKAEGLVALSISPVAVRSGKEFNYLSITLSFSAKYAELGSWIARVEGSSKLLHVVSLSANKGKEIGVNDVQAVVSTLVPKGGRQ
ncbi:MAG: hypothetical protein HY553_06415 [Elusimicrobia bacterium]|nr:hypothetical protein [Elusimicrobiota bacterium]